VPESSLSYLELAPCMTRVTFAGATCAVILFNGIPIQGGPLYQCRDASGAVTYTDNTAQLGRCIPLQSVPVQVTVPSGLSYAPHTAMPSFSEPVTAFPMEPPPVTDVTLPSYDPNSTGMSLETATTAPPPIPSAQPCHPGLNPFNPLGAPPCQVQESHRVTKDPPPFPNDMPASTP
jgi:hypothetical protein